MARGFLYAVTVFLGAFLLLQVQPMLARRIIPWYGGTASVWATCLLFFQLLLVFGYAYAHLSIRFLRPTSQAVLHALLCGVALLVPAMPGDGWKPSPGQSPSAHILTTLLFTVGPRFFVLAATAPLLQAWFARQLPGRSPYPLYALSNAGSMLALLAYPFFFEARFTLTEQSGIWSAGFVGLVLLAVVLGWQARSTRGKRQKSPDADGRSMPTLGTFGLWVAWSASGVILFMAVTNEMTLNMAATPVIWVLPFATYLLSFIISFSGPRFYPRRVLIGLLPVALVAVYLMMRGAIATGADTRYAFGWVEQIVVYIVGLWVLCLICHGELFRLRPQAGRLTEYYLSIAVGGAAGGAAVALAAPRWLLLSQEFHVGIILLVLLLLVTSHRESKPADSSRRRRILRFAMYGLAVCTLIPPIQQARELLRSSVIVERNYYGSIRVVQLAPDEVKDEHRRLYHGKTLHGSQFLGEDRRRRPTAYYSELAAGGALMRLTADRASRNVGVVGLGVGTLATYGRPGDRFSFYEIDPAIVSIAQKQFSYLEESAADHEIFVGDARLTLERQSPNRFDVLILDAFSGDAIPIHLLTREAFALFDRHLAADGIIAVHISNRSVDLTPVLYNIADNLDLNALNIRTLYDDPEQLISQSDWMVLSTNVARLDQLLEYFKPHHEAGRVRLFLGDPERYRKIPLWTDDYSNIFRVMR
ncbi:MAG: fused MFS/spermidine synthase [Acidobacteriota bacterium]|nr:fused MFS/spermidine synthase [Acidobacteriota bacterium]MDH3784599.1 fused MFS/spermidine synthase [Acidobacteriota bacterium]